MIDIMQDSDYLGYHYETEFQMDRILIKIKRRDQKVKEQFRYS
ncbi:unnamed protein product [Paramecium pentaurelia]|uniref:Uncharacterized protein n=1 Tax=Paramecium pentaurelia TaxID=43138 RepID=A0A8S1YGW4_9CILI|nr:unnamed protein product [Paramecium pentaurelia]